MSLRGMVFKLRPTDAQAEVMARFSGVCRLVYNLALEQRRDHWRQFRCDTGRSISYVSQARELTTLRAEFDWIAAVHVTPQQQALRDLDMSYRRFFDGFSGYPTPRRRGINEAFRFVGREVSVRRLNRSWGMVRLPKIGEVRFRWTRDVPVTISNVTVKHDTLGWHVVFLAEVETLTLPFGRPAVGIDRGVAHTLALSDGTFRDLPVERLKVLDRRARKQARAMSRCRRGSNRRQAAKACLARTKAKSARVRKHWHHVESRRIANKYGIVAIEKLKTRNMTASAKGTVEEPGRNVRQKSGLNRSILNQGWATFATLLSYKIADAGGTLIEVDPAFTSQICSSCGIIDKTSRESQARYGCGHCGHEVHADVNAAVNILRAGTRPASRDRVAVPVKRESRKAA